MICPTLICVPPALRAVDATDPDRPISFMRKGDLDYDLSGIKNSSRLMTIIDTPISDSSLDDFIKRLCSEINGGHTGLIYDMDVEVIKE